MNQKNIKEDGLIGGLIGGFGGSNLVDGGRQDGSTNYKLASNEDPKNYKLKNKKKFRIKEGFTDLDSYNSGMPNHPDSGGMNLQTNDPQTLIMLNDPKKKKKKRFRPMADPFPTKDVNFYGKDKSNQISGIEQK